MPLNRRCCCDCPTKEESGMPDSLVASHEILTSTSDGMPADSGIGGGPYDCDPQYHYEHNTDLLELLSDITYDYVETGASSCAACCYHYEGRGSYTPDCPEGAGGGFILFGASPFIAKALGGYFETRIYDLAPSPDPSEPYVGECCPEPSTLGDRDECGRQGEWFGADISLPQPIYGSSDLYICVNGNMVTICETVNFAIPCQTISGGSGEWRIEHNTAGHANPETCDGPYADLSDTVTTGVVTEGCATTGAVLTLTSTADLSGVSGANIWEKIKNAPAETWVSDYEFVACSCAGGGCAESDVFHCHCEYTSTCGHLFGECEPAVHEDEDVDIDCEYSVGTMESTFDDEAP